MVKFGRYLQFHRDYEQTEGSRYIVPYNSLRDEITPSSPLKKNDPDDDKNDEKFITTWRKVLEEASRDLNESTRSCWHKIFDAISSIPQARGAPLVTALRLYIPTVGISHSHDMLNFLKGIHSAAQVNSEALRKLVKKYDKQADTSLSKLLLPDLYGSILTFGQSTISMAIETIRALLDDVDIDIDVGFDSDVDSVGNDNYCNNHNIQSEEKLIRRRADEIQWLGELTREMSSDDLQYVVAHRGFHDNTGRTNIRPLENSLAAFEAAWSHGIHLCEGDVALTRDERLVLAHDENFLRLALDPSSDRSREKVRDLTFKELIALTLKNGVRAPLLLDVLRSAKAIGGNAQLIIEIKPGNTEVFLALARLLGRHPDLMPQVAAIMSFDVWSMHQIRSELTQIASQGIFDNNQVGQSPLLKRAEHDQDSAPYKLPDLFLLTDVTGSIECNQSKHELWLDVLDLEPVDGWLERPGGSLDGIYMRFQPKMMESKGTTQLRVLSKKYKVGIWLMKDEDPDNIKTLQYLVRECNISFYNTDMPKDFVN